MRKNIGYGERTFRALAGLAILGLYGALDPPLKYLTLVGLIPLGTALTGYCPAFAWLRRNRELPSAGGTQ